MEKWVFSYQSVQNRIMRKVKISQTMDHMSGEDEMSGTMHDVSD